MLDSTLAVKNNFLASAAIQLEKDKAAFVVTAAQNVGFLERNKALHDLSNEEESVNLANMLISLLIILLETAPVLAKLLLPVGPYDISLAKQELVPMTSLERALVVEQENARSSNLSAV